MLKLTNISASIGICCLFYFFFYFYFTLLLLFNLLYFHFSQGLTALMSFLYGLSPSRMLSAGSLPCLTVKRDPAKTHRNYITMINKKILYKKIYFPSSPLPTPLMICYLKYFFHKLFQEKSSFYWHSRLWIDSSRVPMLRRIVHAYYFLHALYQ